MTDSPPLSYASSREIPTLFYTIKPEKGSPFGRSHHREYSLVVYKYFSLTWPASRQIYGNKRNRLHNERVLLSRDLFVAPTWPPLHCFGTPIQWPP